MSLSVRRGEETSVPDAAVRSFQEDRTIQLKILKLCPEVCFNYLEPL